MLKSFFNLTKKERKASVYFIMLMLVLLMVKYWASSDKNTVVSEVFVEQVADEVVLKEISQTRNKKASPERFVENKKKIKIDSRARVNVTSFFDPNRMAQSDWVSFGLSEKQAVTMMRFIDSRGGVVEAEELLDVYVLSKEDKEVLVSWCRIDKESVNEWEQADFKRIKGVGEVLTLRIMKYRDKLGGFYSLNQLNEVYGLDSSVVNKIKERTKITVVNSIAINSWSYRELMNHPYIAKSEAKLIIKQRTIAPFKEESQLFEVFSDEKKIERLKPYISYE